MRAACRGILLRKLSEISYLDHNDTEHGLFLEQRRRGCSGQDLTGHRWPLVLKMSSLREARGLRSQAIG